MVEPPSNVPQRIADPLGGLPETAEAYRRRDRLRGDPIGQRGLPTLRGDLDLLVRDLRDELRHAGERGLRGPELAERLGLTGGTRALRLLRRYAEAYCGIHGIIGSPGGGYRWSDSAADHAVAARRAARRGRDYFHQAGLHDRAGGRQRALPMEPAR